jgi:hypothetical protein
LNFRPHGPEPSGDATQPVSIHGDAQQGASVSGTSTPDKPVPNGVDALAAALVGLSEADRLRLVALLLGGGKPK